MAHITKLCRLVYVLLILTLVSCTPDINDCQFCVEQEFKNTVKVIDITKTNGVKSQILGISAYDAYFSCTVEFLENYELKAPMIGTFESYAKGEKLHIEKAHVRFVDTDNGWVCNGIDYDALYGLSFIDARGNKIPYNDYRRMQKEEKVQAPSSVAHEDSAEPQNNTAKISEANSLNEYTVIADKSYFHDSANTRTRRKGYLVKGEKITLLSQQGDFGYTEFTNARGTVTKGWIDVNTLSVLTN